MDYASGILQRFNDFVITPLVYLIFTTGFLLFLWGLIEFLWKIRGGGDTEQGKNHMIWGLAGMLIMVSVWSIISLIGNTIGVDPLNPVDTSRIQNINPTGGFFPGL